MHPVLRHVLSPFLAAVLGSLAIIDILVSPQVGPVLWVPWSLGAGLVSGLWWFRRRDAGMAETSAYTGLLALASLGLVLSVLPLLSPMDQAWCVGLGLFAAGVGAYSLASFLPAAVTWLAILATPAVVLSGPRSVLVGGVVAVWLIVCLLRHRSIRAFSVEWEATLLRDPVTQLEHQRGFEAKVAAVLSSSAPRSAYLGVLSVDRLKDINQAFGHSYGDRLLQGVAERLAGLLGVGDSATRTGGSEIIVLLAGAKARTELLVRQLQGGYSLDGNRTVVGISSGWAERPVDVSDPLVWINQARLALASNAGENRSSYFDPSLEERLHLRQRYSDHLERALVDREPDRLAADGHARRTGDGDHAGRRPGAGHRGRGAGHAGGDERARGEHRIHVAQAAR